MAESASAVTVVCLKSYGDLVIARCALRQALAANAPARPGLAIGSHLLELNDALGAGPQPQVVVHREAGVPAFYDARKSGLAPALRSGIALRSALARLSLAPHTTLLFDQKTLRETFLAVGRSAASLGAAPNIYLAYEAALGGSGSMPDHATVEAVFRVDHRAPYVGIFPGSRIARKRLPGDVIEALVAICAAAGAACKVFALDGEPIDFSLVRAEVVRVPRSFAAMIAAVREARAIVSSDSLPAHLAEYFGRPVFVASPVPNAYWLPRSSFQLDRWCLFPDLARSTGALRDFVAPRP